VHKLLVTLFTCPGCGIVDKSVADPSQVSRARLLSGIGSFIGCTLVLSGLMYLAVNIFGQIFSYTPTEEGWAGTQVQAGNNPADQVSQWEASMESGGADAWDYPLSMKCTVDNVAVFDLACKGRVKAWFITWALYVFLQFNLFLAWGNTDPTSNGCFFPAVGDIVGLGQWRIEKQRFQRQIVSALAKMEAQWSIQRNIAQAQHRAWEYCAPSKRDKHDAGH